MVSSGSQLQSLALHVLHTFVIVHTVHTSALPFRYLQIKKETFPLSGCLEIKSEVREVAFPWKVREQQWLDATLCNSALRYPGFLFPEHPADRSCWKEALSVPGFWSRKSFSPGQISRKYSPFFFSFCFPPYVLFYPRAQSHKDYLDIFHLISFFLDTMGILGIVLFCTCSAQVLSLSITEMF